MPNLSDIQETDWDVIIIGTGIGGGTAGRALAEAGKKVLFLEKGPAGFRREETALDPGMFDPVARQIRGFWPDPVQAEIDGKSQSFFAPLGAGLGGSSVFYAATLERPAPHDLDDLPDFPHPTGGWPISYSEMSPWLDQAERLYHVAGSPDPLADAAALAETPDLEPGDQVLFEALRTNGLHPYKLHAALARLPECAECLGRKCPRACKLDGRSAGVEPALETGNAAMLTDCEVTCLHEDGRIEARHGGAILNLSAPSILLAAGALSSPRLLLASHCETHPKGLGNSTDQVGRNLMFHLNEMFALWPGRQAGDHGPSKSIGFRDFYFAEGQRLGMVQAMGVDVGYGEIVHYLRQRVERSRLARLPGAMDLTRIPAAIGAKLLGTAKVFVGLLEDLPYAENRVSFDPNHPDQIRFSYSLQPELLARRRLFRTLIRRGVKGMRSAFLTYEPELNYGHPCGTLRMGNDPKTSATDAVGRLFGVPNIRVVDASAFPTSMGVNPSLTIAANALRIADDIVRTR